MHFLSPLAPPPLSARINGFENIIQDTVSTAPVPLFLVVAFFVCFGVCDKKTLSICGPHRCRRPAMAAEGADLAKSSPATREPIRKTLATREPTQNVELHEILREVVAGRLS